jgi:hypothetical protein
MEWLTRACETTLPDVSGGPAMSEINTIDVGTFDEKGGVNIGVGALQRLYTLRNDFFDWVQTAEGPIKVRRSHHYRNLGKDWDEVVTRLPEILKALHLPMAVYVPGYVSGRLDPNNPPVPVVIPENFPLGKYRGKSIEEVKALDPGYAVWFATQMWVSARDKATFGFKQKVADAMAPEIAAMQAQKEEAQATYAAKKAERAKVFAPYAEALKKSWAYGYWKSEIDAFGEGEIPRDRVQDRWAEAYAKGFGRANSKKFKAAYNEFHDALAPFNEEDEG